jgi:hypothetical protein
VDNYPHHGCPAHNDIAIGIQATEMLDLVAPLEAGAIAILARFLNRV